MGHTITTMLTADDTNTRPTADDTTTWLVESGTIPIGFITNQMDCAYFNYLGCAARLVRHYYLGMQRRGTLLNSAVST